MLYHKVSISCMQFTFYKMTVVIIPFGCFVPPIPCHNSIPVMCIVLFAITDSAFQQYAFCIQQNAFTLDAI